MRFSLDCRVAVAVEFLLLVATALAGCAAPVALAQDRIDIDSLIARQSSTLTSPPRHVPSGTTVDGALLGNGDVGVVLGGPPESLQFYVGKNDFWSQQGSPMSVGSVRLSVPALVGASYHVDQDIQHAEVRGAFAKQGASLATTSWVAATENLLVTELRATGTQAMTVRAELLPHAPRVQNTANNIEIGREQTGNGRNYFSGLIDEVLLYDRAVSAPEVEAIAAQKEPQDGLVRRWSFDADEGKDQVNAPAKLVHGPSGCPGSFSIARPDERPTDEPLGCNPQGYHLDYQPFGVGKSGRAVKLMHAWNYIDAGPAPAVERVSVAAWVYIFEAGDSNFIVSKGAWNEAYSLSLDHGRLRFNIGEAFARSATPLPTNRWLQVAGTFDGTQLRIYVDGKECLPAARFIESEREGGVLSMSRNADGPLDEQYAFPSLLPPTSNDRVRGREITVALRGFGTQIKAEDSALSFELKPGETVYLVAPILSDLDAADDRASAHAMAAAVTEAQIQSLLAAHRDWWRHFWEESAVAIGDPMLERFYYTSQYILAASSRSGKVFPGLYGPWVTSDHPSWNGDFTLDYNYETTALGLYASNHIATSDAYDPPILDFMDRGRLYAKTLLDVNGLYYPGHIGPWGTERPFDYDPFMSMKSNAAFSAVPMLMRFYSTYDPAYEAKIYPYIKGVAEFWADYLVKQGDRYVIRNACVDEVGPWGSHPDWSRCPADFNSTADLAFVHDALQGALDLSSELGEDAPLRPRWQERLSHLSVYPTGVTKDGPILLNGEGAAMARADWGTLIVWPAGQAGIGRDEKLLSAVRNTMKLRGYSNFVLVPPALARIGADPEWLLTHLREGCEKSGFPNGYLDSAGGGVETAALVPPTIDEMLMQSYTGTIRLFPDWPMQQDARFERLRAYGAFLVSSALKGGRVADVAITSERGRELVLVNPWPRAKVAVLHGDGSQEIVSGETLRIGTGISETIRLRVQ